MAEAILAVAWLSLRYFEKPLLDYGQNSQPESHPVMPHLPP